MPLQDFETMARELVAGEAYGELCRHCLVHLEALCSKAFSTEDFEMKPFDWFPEPKLAAFGSYVQGTALRTSDLDVRLSIVQRPGHGRSSACCSLGSRCSGRRNSCAT